MFDFINFIKKPKFYFDIRNSPAIRNQEIMNTEELITYVIEENTRLLDLGETGVMIIVKYKEKKDERQVLFAKKLELPMDEANAYFDEILYDFYTKKPVEFDSSVLSDSVDAYKKITKSPELPKAIEEIVTKEEQYQILLKEVGQLKEQIQQLEAERELSAECEETIVSSEENLSRSNTLVDEFPSLTEPMSMLAIEEKIETQTELEKCMLKLLAKEQQRIDSELSSSINREKITEDVKKRYQSITAQELQVLRNNIEQKKAEAIDRENKRHKNELNRIQEDCEKDEIQKKEEIENKYRDMVNTEIEKEYTNQISALKEKFQKEKMLLLSIQNKVTEKIDLVIQSIDRK